MLKLNPQSNSYPWIVTAIGFVSFLIGASITFLILSGIQIVIPYASIILYFIIPSVIGFPLIDILVYGGRSLKKILIVCMIMPIAQFVFMPLLFPLFMMIYSLGGNVGQYLSEFFNSFTILYQAVIGYVVFMLIMFGKKGILRSTRMFVLLFFPFMLLIQFILSLGVKLGTAEFRYMFSMFLGSVAYGTLISMIVGFKTHKEALSPESTPTLDTELK